MADVKAQLVDYLAAEVGRIDATEAIDRAPNPGIDASPIERRAARRWLAAAAAAFVVAAIAFTVLTRDEPGVITESPNPPIVTTTTPATASTTIPVLEGRDGGSALDQGWQVVETTEPVAPAGRLANGRWLGLTERGLAWSSDGIDWNPISPPAWAEHDVLSFLVAADLMWVGLWDPAADVEELWISDDGERWRQPRAVEGDTELTLDTPIQAPRRAAIAQEIWWNLASVQFTQPLFLRFEEVVVVVVDDRLDLNVSGMRSVLVSVDGGNTFRYDDTFELVDPFGTITWSWADDRGVHVVFQRVDGSRTLFRSTDGTGWTPEGPVHGLPTWRLDQWPTSGDPPVIASQAGIVAIDPSGNSLVFRSDEGLEWVPIRIPSGALADDPADGWATTSRSVVSRDGETWYALGVDLVNRRGVLLSPADSTPPELVAWLGPYAALIAVPPISPPP